jgi:hypothetical protein
MAKPQTTPPDHTVEQVAVIPEDLRMALMIWWTAHHHGSQQEEQDAAETLCEAISPRISAMREMAYGKRT